MDIQIRQSADNINIKALQKFFNIGIEKIVYENDHLVFVFENNDRVYIESIDSDELGVYLDC